MMRRPMQDIVPKEGRTIRNIPIPETRVKSINRLEKKEPIREVRKEKVQKIEEDVDRVPLNLVYEKSEPVAHEEVSDDKPLISDDLVASRGSGDDNSDDIGGGKKKRSFKGFIVGGVVLAVIVLAFFASTMFHRATVTVTPRVEEAAISSEYTAKRSAALGELPFEIITLKQTSSETVKATGEKQVERRATGVITIYNNYSSAAQRLIKNTRFATPEGLIFRISDSVNVPGKVGTTPGSVDATVTADEPGEKYNVGMKDFTIPGFKGDPRFTGFYARSKTAIAGGFVGVEKIVADADRAKAKTNIEAKITAELERLAPGQVPANKILFPDAASITFVSLPEESASASEVTLKEEGTLTMVVFDREQLSSKIAEKAELSGYNKEPILITNLDSFTFVPKNTIKPTTLDSLTFTLSGNARFEWVYDEVLLKQNLAGKSRADMPLIVAKFPTLKKVDLSIKPIWLRKIPESLSKITIEKSE